MADPSGKTSAVDIFSPRTWPRRWRRFAVITAPVFFPIYFASVALGGLLLIVLGVPARALYDLWHGNPPRPYEM